MRADRLIAALLTLQARERVTASELATELEVSVSTARRDLEALALAGVPVYPQRGRGGGWSLVGRARTDLSGLTEPEARALLLLVGPAAARSPAASAALRKLVQALPATFRTDARAATEAVLLDPARWGEHARDRPAMVERLQAAVVRRRRIRLVYDARSGERTERPVDPWGLVDKDDVWYLVAGTERGRRTFRVDRVVAATPTDEPAERPDDFALSAAWRDIVGEVEDRRARTWATVRIAPRFATILEGQFGRHVRHLEDDDGCARLRIGAPTPLDIARHLAGWGELIEVIEPQAVRAELARIGAELVASYPRNL